MEQANCTLQDNVSLQDLLTQRLHFCLLDLGENANEILNLDNYYLVCSKNRKTHRISCGIAPIGETQDFIRPVQSIATLKIVRLFLVR